MTDLLAPEIRGLERVIIHTPLGIRFWDSAADGPVTQGLLVTARQAAHPDRRVRATATRSGVYAFFGMPGLRAIEYPPRPLTGIGSPPHVERYFVDVVDTAGRFVPVAFQADAPFPGIFPIGIAQNGGGVDAPGFYLFPSTTRVAPASLGVVRAELVDRATGDSARHAVVELELTGGRHVFGIADGSGRVAVHFPYPSAVPPVLSPPPTPDDVRQPASWAATVRVRYGPASQDLLVAGLPPDLASLFAQPSAAIHATHAGPPVTDLGVTVVAGQETVLRTDSEPFLLVG